MVWKSVSSLPKAVFWYKAFGLRKNEFAWSVNGVKEMLKHVENNEPLVFTNMKFGEDSPYCPYPSHSSHSSAAPLKCNT